MASWAGESSNEEMIIPQKNGSNTQPETEKYDTPLVINGVK